MRHDREEARLEALHQLQLLDTPPSESFDRITRLASQVFSVPVAAVSLTDRDRQWFKSRVGIDHSSIPRDRAPCSQVAETIAPLVIEDLLADPIYAESNLAHAGTRFYAGAPLITSSGHGLGSLCVLGTEPRQVTAAELVALTDLAAIVMSEIELQHAFGRLDPVSGLPTRTQFRDDLADLARDHPGERRYLVVVDLARDNQVSRITRVLGASRIDQLLREAASAVRSALGPARTIYHVAATQFAFVSAPDLDQARYLKQIEVAFEKIRVSSSVRFVTNVAIGVRPFIVGAISGEDVLRGAVSAAHDARQADGSIALYSDTNDAMHRRQYGLLDDFGSALETGDQLRLVYQPRIDIRTGRCVGAEALLRWRHPLLGEIPPGEFIPIIEHTSLAKLTTQWVLNTALDHLVAWKRMSADLIMSVNISAANLSEVDLVQRIQLGLARRHLRPEWLEIELTETAIMDQRNQALAMLSELAETGVRLAIDDFGTGHSSLAYLQRLPAHVMKIDQTFVRGLRATGPEFVLLEMMVGLAHRLGFRVVAEGVETREVAAILATIGCEEGQGFHFSPPIEATEFGQWFAEQRRGAAQLRKAG